MNTMLTDFFVCKTIGIFLPTEYEITDEHYADEHFPSMI